LRGTRGAATLLKSNVSRETVTLRFRSKGGKVVHKEFAAPRLVLAIARLRDELPGRRAVPVSHRRRAGVPGARARRERLSA